MICECIICPLGPVIRNHTITWALKPRYNMNQPCELQHLAQKKETGALAEARPVSRARQ